MLFSCFQLDTSLLEFILILVLMGRRLNAIMSVYAVIAIAISLNLCGYIDKTHNHD